MNCSNRLDQSYLSISRISIYQYLSVVVVVLEYPRGVKFYAKFSFSCWPKGLTSKEL